METILTKNLTEVIGLAIAIISACGIIIGSFVKAILNRLDKGNELLTHIDKELALTKQISESNSHNGRERDKKLSKHQDQLQELYVTTTILKHQQKER